VRLQPLQREEIERLQPLWLQLHTHHQQVAPALQPFVDPLTSWSARRAQYGQALDSGGFVLLALEAAVPVGYLVAARTPSPWPAMFAGSEPVMELVTLAVDPAWRGSGIGSRLLDRFEAEPGARDCFVGVIPANSRAIGLYRRRGFLPVSLLLLRFARQAPSTDAAGLTIAAVMPSEIEALQPLWRSWYAQQQRAAPELGPYVAAAASWDRAKAGLLPAAVAGRLFRAGPADRPVGLASITLADAGGFADTWVTNGPNVAEITILAAGDDQQAIVLALLHFADRHLAGLGITDLMVNVPAWDAMTIETCRCQGFQPGWLQLKRFC
jgi:GNAT superfamily N-acetyltransferase